MIDRISNFVKGAFSMTSFGPPSDHNPSAPCLVKAVTPASVGTLKLPENTVRGCRDRATADLLKAVTVMTANERRRLEHSAESWTLRANLLDRLDKSSDKRAALDRAHEQYEIDHVRL
jgi:hypothetical protein